MPEPTQEELDLIQAGQDYRELKRMAGWRSIVKHLVAYCNDHEERLRRGRELEDRASLRLLDTWRAREDMYAEIITEVDGTIAQLEAKEKELRELGIQYPELSIGQTGQGE
jgi:hypothetical protein